MVFLTVLDSMTLCRDGLASLVSLSGGLEGLGGAAQSVYAKGLLNN